MGNKLSLRDFKNAKERKEFLEKELNIKLDNIGNFSFPEDTAVGRNIENLIGATQIPLGVAGPLLAISHSPLAISKKQKANSQQQKAKSYFIPLATTEGALVASVSRGCKAITKAGGVSVYVEEVGITRGPVFKVNSIKEGFQAKEWIDNHIKELTRITEQTSHHLKLKKIGCRLVGRNLFVRFYFNTADAMGMNMATIATQEAADLIEENTQAECVSISGNFCIDKKPAWLNFISGRGKRVWAEVVLNKKIVKEVLKSTPEELAELVYRKCLLGSIMSGSLGHNGHYANIAAAIFAATGQDLAHVTEASLGITTAEVLQNGDLYFSVYLPSLEIGTVGGGIHLPTQQEALKIMQVDNVLEYATLVGGAMLAGELSLLASLAEGSLAKAHQKLGRKNKSQETRIKSLGKQ